MLGQGPMWLLPSHGRTPLARILMSSDYFSHGTLQVCLHFYSPTKLRHALQPTAATRTQRLLVAQDSPALRTWGIVVDRYRSIDDVIHGRAVGESC